MAVNRIRYRDGKKICIPITKKAEYMALRDADFNRKCVERARRGETFASKSGEQKSYKTLLEQFNYSCYPNEDGTLKGTTKPADSVGMDVDFDETEKGKIPEVIERILEKKEEIGLLMLERSATKGLHLVFRRKPELSQEGNLRWVSERLDVPFDEAAKDITRVFFTPTGKDVIYIDEKIFERRETPATPATPFPPLPHTPMLSTSDFPFPVKGQGDSNDPSSNHKKPISEKAEGAWRRRRT